MARGRKRNPNLAVPAHIDAGKLPKGLYWDASGTGRWFVFEDHPEGGPRRRKTVASSRARMSELHEIMESRAGGSARGTLDWMWDQFKESTEFKDLSGDSRRDYKIHAELLKHYPTRAGTFGQLRVEVSTAPILQRLVEAIARGKEETRPGAGDAVKGRPSTANHALRYISRLCAWGIRFGHCSHNPARGVKQAREASRQKGAALKKLPKLHAYRALLSFAKERGALKSHSAGSCSPYLAPVIEIVHSCACVASKSLT